MRLRWPWGRKPEQVTPRALDINDPAFAALVSFGLPDLSGTAVGEYAVMGIPAVNRAVSLISDTLASLPLRTMRAKANGERERVTTFLNETPGGPGGPTPFEWKQTVFGHLLLHGDAFLVHLRNGAGVLVGLVPIHPTCVTVEWEKDDNGKATGRKTYTARLVDGSQRTFTQDELTQVMGRSFDGLRGMSPIALHRSTFGTNIAANTAAAKMFANGLSIAAMVTPTGDGWDKGDAKQIKADLEMTMTGPENAGGIAVINREVKVDPLQMTAADAQYIEQRQYGVEEVARIFGVPPFELMQTEKQTSWGTGIEAQQRGLGRTVLAPWATRVDECLSRLLARGTWAEFDFAGLERPTPEQEIDLLIRQVEAGLLTRNEARAIRNLPPIDGGDVLLGGQAPAPAGDGGNGAPPAK